MMVTVVATLAGLLLGCALAGAFGWYLLRSRSYRRVQNRFVIRLGQILALISIGANWLKNRSFHCAITGPLFLIAGVAFLLAAVSVIHVNTGLVWQFVLIGIAIAFLLEWRYAKRSAS
jgi:hypothetical protein